jgi:hypothetical protein
MTIRIPRRMTALLLAGCFSPLMASPQTIQIQRQAFIDAPALPIAPPPKPASAVAPGSAALVAVTPVPPPAPAQAALTSTTTYSVARSDRTHREVLVKWARASGWTFEPEHWAVARDIPVAGVASVDTDFKTAVRMLLRSTELTDLPVQPCFYNPNRTLRVVPINDSCTRGN